MFAMPPRGHIKHFEFRLVCVKCQVFIFFWKIFSSSKAYVFF